MNKIFQIGVTGGIGSGKSTVCRIFEVLGIPTYEADSRAKWLMNHDATLISAITERFGSASYENGLLNREYLSKTVFQDEEQVAFMNSLIHPRVKEDYQQWVQVQKGVPYVVREAAIMLEEGYHEHLDAVINVAASPAIRMDRVLIRDMHRTQAQVEAIMEKQLSEEIRKERATFSISNDGKKMVLPQVIRLHKRFSKGEINP